MHLNFAHVFMYLIDTRLFVAVSVNANVCTKWMDQLIYFVF